jgi:hypothetical protein
MHVYRDARFVYQSFSIDFVNFWPFGFGFVLVKIPAVGKLPLAL